MTEAVYCTRGMQTFGIRIAEILDAPLYVDCPVGDVDRVFVCGMYDPPDYEHTLRNIARAKHKHFHWCGTDVLLLTHPEVLPKATHSADGEHLVKELYDKGIDARCALTPTINVGEVQQFPSEPIVGVYVGSDARKYGMSTLNGLIEALPEVKFHVYQFGQHRPEDMPTVMAQCRATVRLTRHDGGACSVREFLAAGRRAVATVDLPHVKRVRPDDLPEIVRAVRNSIRHDEPDYEAAAYYQALNAPESFKAAVEGWGTWER